MIESWHPKTFEKDKQLLYEYDSIFKEQLRLTHIKLVPQMKVLKLATPIIYHTEQSCVKKENQQKDELFLMRALRRRVPL